MPSIPVVQNVEATVHDGVEEIRDALARQLYLPVRWTAMRAGAGGRWRDARSPNADPARC